MNNIFFLSGIKKENGLIEATLTHGLTVSHRKKVTGFENDRNEGVSQRNQES